MNRAEIQRRLGQLNPAQRVQLGRRLAQRHPEIAPQGEPQLIAYLTGSAEPNSLRRALQNQLPASMLPSNFVVLNDFPRTATGKIDRNALPAPASKPSLPEKIMSGDATINTLTDIWEELLGISRPTADENFFDLGGHSLMAIRLTSRIQKTFGVGIPVADVFRLPTINQQANLLRTSETSALTNAVVPISTGGTRLPLFALHCGNGSVHHYFLLARELGNDQPVYGLQPPSQNGLEPIPNTLQEIAFLYLIEVTKIQPNGPYRLCGYSFGGVIAYEMAQQLTARGEQVELVAMFDTIMPPRESISDRFDRHADRIARLSRTDKLLYLSRSALGVVRNFFKMARLYLLRLRKRAPVKFYKLLRRPLPVEYRAEFLNTGLQKSADNYQPKPYSGNIVLFCAHDGSWLDKEFPERGWQGLPRKILVEKMQGWHGAMLLESGVKRTAERLRAHLNGDISNK